MAENDVQIGEISLRDTFGLTLYDIDIGAPELKTQYRELPLSSGVVDLSETVTGAPVYGTRTVTLYLAREDRSPENWLALGARITGALHGRRLPILLDFDPEHYCLGRISCETDKKSFEVSVYTISAVCDPFRYRRALSARTLAAGTNAVRNGGGMTVSPTLTASAGGMTVALNGGASYSIAPASTPVRIPELLLLPGENSVSVTGEGTLTLEWREGDL